MPTETSRLRTREPSGHVAYPMLLLEGGEKAGKTHAALSLSASERVGRTFVFELGERAADEYGPLGRFEIVEHNGTYADLLDQLRAACAEPSTDDRPNAIVIDSVSMLWALLKDQASASARRSKRAVKILAEDPDADIETTMTYWTTAKERWWAVMNTLRGWPGITVLTCRAGEVTKVQGGQPVAGQTEWSRDVEKGTPFAMTGIVRFAHPRPPTLVAVQSLHLSLPAKGLELPQDDALAALIFETLGAGGGFEQSPVVNPVAGIPTPEAKNMLWAEGCDHLDRDAAKDAAVKAWAAAGLEGRVEVSPEELATAKGLLLEAIAPPEGDDQGATSEPTATPPPSEDPDAGADTPESTTGDTGARQSAADKAKGQVLEELIDYVTGLTPEQLEGELVRHAEHLVWEGVPDPPADADKRRVLTTYMASRAGVL